MKRRDYTLALSLCLSLALHATMGTLVLTTVLPARPQRAVAQMPDSAPPIYLDQRHIMGDQSGTGTATHSAPGELEQRARQGSQDQPLLSRDPEGPGPVGNLPSASVLQQASEQSAAGKPTPASLLMTTGQGAVSIFGPTLPSEALSTPRSPLPPADPAPMSDSESDAFSSGQGKVDFGAGQLLVRFGRKVRTVRPRLTYAAQLDAIELVNCSLQLSVKTDATGKVTAAQVIRSSGKPDIDQATLLAMYQWWIQPPLDKDGKPQADVTLWEIRFH